MQGPSEMEAGSQTIGTVTTELRVRITRRAFKMQTDAQVTPLESPIQLVSGEEIRF